MASLPGGPPSAASRARAERSGEHGALGRPGLGMTAPPGAGAADVAAAPAGVAQRALDQAVLFQPADQPGQRAPSQVDRRCRAASSMLTLSATSAASTSSDTVPTQ
jgi:hypothetical protein